MKSQQNRIELVTRPDRGDPELGAVVEDAQVAAPNLDRLVVLEPKHLGKGSALGLQSDKIRITTEAPGH